MSTLYDPLFYAKNTACIKEKWGKEAGITTSWRGICSSQLSPTNSMDWREHCWKDILRPHSRKNIGIQVWCAGENASQWRRIISIYSGTVPDWVYIGITFQRVTYPWTWRLFIWAMFSFWNIGWIQSCCRPFWWQAEKKSITIKWLNPIPPTVEDWCGMIM